MSLTLDNERAHRHFPLCMPMSAMPTLLPADFLTEGGDPPASDSSLSAEPMGSSASVPRCLRWPSRVQLHPWTVEQAEGLVHDVWQVRLVPGKPS